MPYSDGADSVGPEAADCCRTYAQSAKAPVAIVGRAQHPEDYEQHEADHEEAVWTEAVAHLDLSNITG
tara:strand:- start:292 stop:495 length:204 start_codon:yes stop_codon:yes gene_type:complete